MRTLRCCLARKLEADRRGKALISVDSEGSNDNAEQCTGAGRVPAARSFQCEHDVSLRPSRDRDVEAAAERIGRYIGSIMGV